MAAIATYSLPKLRDCHWNQSRFKLFHLPTVPRSGNTLTRLLLEEYTGVATEAVFAHEGFASKRTNGYVKAHGISRLARVKPSHDTDFAILKSHWPFHGPTVEGRCMSGILKTVRHPVDNWLAWLYYKGRVNHAQRTRGKPTFTAFLRKWEEHHLFWDTYVRKHNIPLLQFRFEDLCAYTTAVMRQILTFIGYEPKHIVHMQHSNQSIVGSCYLRNVRTQNAWILEGDELSTTRKSYLTSYYNYSSPLFENILATYL